MFGQILTLATVYAVTYSIISLKEKRKQEEKQKRRAVKYKPYSMKAFELFYDYNELEKQEAYKINRESLKKDFTDQFSLNGIYIADFVKEKYPDIKLKEGFNSISVSDGEPYIQKGFSKEDLQIGTFLLNGWALFPSKRKNRPDYKSKEIKVGDFVNIPGKENPLDSYQQFLMARYEGIKEGKYVFSYTNHYKSEEETIEYRVDKVHLNHETLYDYLYDNIYNFLPRYNMLYRHRLGPEQLYPRIKKVEVFYSV